MGHVHSIRTRLTVLLTLMATIVYGAVAFDEVNEKSAQIKDELLSQIDALLDVQVDALSVPLWNFDQEEVERQIGVLVTHNDIVDARVVGSDGAEFARAATAGGAEDNPRNVGDQTRDRAGDWQVAPSAVHTIERYVRYGSDTIGKMARALQVFKANAEQLKVALERERELNGLQRQFVSMVSHEFRTPLAVIDGNAQRLLRRPDPKSERLTATMQKIRTAIISLTDLMESVLNASRLEEGRIAFDPDPCHLTELLGELCDSYAELNADRILHVDLDGLPDRIIADRKLLRQVFSNLLSNAIKYSPDGKNIWVTGRLKDDDLVISIRDEGVGIPAAELKKLFSRFFRASTSTGIAGSGIGFHLVKHFVELHGGRVEVDSRIEEGATFTVRMPCSRSLEAVTADAA